MLLVATKWVARCGVCGGARNPSGAQVCKECYYDPVIRRDYINQGATKEFAFDTWLRVEIKPDWRTPKVELIWWSPEVTIATPDEACGWALIGLPDDLPTNPIIVAGEDHAPIIARRVPSEIWFPWRVNGKFYRWDQFDWWRPIATAS